MPHVLSAEAQRLDEDAARTKNWKRWGPYLSERQWGTVREDYSEHGTCWDYFPHDHARSRAYRWGEDGLLGICDRECRLAFALALWNGRDPILKERLFGLTGPEGNHGEDVKECYYYLDATPSGSYLRALYKYPQREFPYGALVEGNHARTRTDPELEITDTGIFDDGRYFDVFAEYAKESPDDILIRITVANRGPERATLHLIPTLWFRNTWSPGRTGDGYWPKPAIRIAGGGSLETRHATLEPFRLDAAPVGGRVPTPIVTENETNFARVFGGSNPTPYVKDSFHDYVIHGRAEAVNPDGVGTKGGMHYVLDVDARSEVVVRLRLRHETEASKTIADSFSPEFDAIFARRIAECDEFYAARTPKMANEEEARVMRQGYAGLLWSKQFYFYVVKDWLEGDPAYPTPPASRLTGRNAEWQHLYNRDIISMPDAWEYPWYAAWDLAFHMIPMAKIDPAFAKEQLVLMLREWYTHPNGQMPAYEFAFNDVNPPVHAWACWRVYKLTGARGARDRLFLQRVFHKLLINFTWWVNRKDIEGNNLFAGGFLGLDNIGVFDRSQPLPLGGHLEQADGTAWMGFYCTTMLAMAMELAMEDPAYEDVASKFFEHFIAISDAMNTLGGTGLWNEADGFYYDQMHVGDVQMPLAVRSMVGLIPLFTVEILNDAYASKIPGFAKRARWFLENRKDLAQHISYMDVGKPNGGQPGAVKRLLAIPSRDRLERMLRYMLDESEFLSPYGVRSLSRVHREHPFVLTIDGRDYRVDYDPGESTTGLFGGNSNWRGPVWFPLNFLLIEALERYHHFYGEKMQVECPVGSGNFMNLKQVAQELTRRLGSLFLPDATGQRPSHGADRRYADDPHWKDLVLFHEYFHGDTGSGAGASHQTGWTALAVWCVEETARLRTRHQAAAHV